MDSECGLCGLSADPEAGYEVCSDCRENLGEGAFCCECDVLLVSEGDDFDGQECADCKAEGMEA